ncbi:MAG TPA: TetR/AcrR family transcriptional regulator [Jatrophihabitantaceae bacterium]|jgi:AcrR family transcriptional regulator
MAATVPVEKRRGRPRDAGADEAILDAAVDLLAEQGFLALSIEAVAARAGVAKTTVYRRWPNKDELLLDAVGCIKGPPVDAPGESVRSDILWMLIRMRDGWFKGRFGRLMARLAVDGLERPDLYREGRARYVAPRQAVMRGIIQRGIDDGSIRAGVDPDWVMALLTSPVISAAFTHQDAPSNRQLEFIVDTVLRGVAP